MAATEVRSPARRAWCKSFRESRSASRPACSTERWSRQIRAKLGASCGGCITRVLLLLRLLQLFGPDRGQPYPPRIGQVLAQVQVEQSAVNVAAVAGEHPFLVFRPQRLPHLLQEHGEK